MLEVHEDLLRATLAPVGDHLLERLAVADLEALLPLVLAEGAQLHARHGLARSEIAYCLVDAKVFLHFGYVRLAPGYLVLQVAVLGVHLGELHLHLAGLLVVPGVDVRQLLDRLLLQLGGGRDAAAGAGE